MNWHNPFFAIALTVVVDATVITDAGAITDADGMTYGDVDADANAGS